MAIPDYQSIMLPLLKFAGDKKEHSIRDAIVHISGLFNLSNEEKRELLSSGQQPIINNRTGWARTYLKKAGLLESPRKSYFKITDIGLNVLKQNPAEINSKYLEQFPGFVEFKTIKKTDAEILFVQYPQAEGTPRESIEENILKLQNDLGGDLIIKIKQSSPEFFERLVVDLLLKMGYGGSQKEAGEAIGKSGDEGIDGIIKEDKLGLDTIYIQAKRWDGTVGRPEIQKFIGALQMKGAKKGIFITASNFSKEARESVDMTGSTKIVLIDGELLVNFMIQNDVGVSKIASYEIKQIDSDYFSEE